MRSGGRSPREALKGTAVAGWDGPRAGVEDDESWVKYFGRRVALMRKTAQELEDEMAQAEAWAERANTARWGRAVERERALRALERSDPDLFRRPQGAGSATTP